MARREASKISEFVATTANTHPVLDLIRERARAGSQPRSRRDDARLGLVIEGGAMRGVVSAGMLRALEELGLRDTFDAVYGSSAGAVNGAFFVAGQAEYGSPIYPEHINNAHFISLWRSLTRRPVMSLSYLLDDVMARRVILDWRAVLESPIRFKIAATSIADMGVRLLEGFSDRGHLFAALRASSSVPWIAGPPMEIGGEHFLDALLFEPVPFRSAVRDGCTHVLVLLTRPDGTLSGDPSLFERHVLGRWIASLEPQLRDAYLAQQYAYDDQIRQLKATSVEAEGGALGPLRDDPTCFCALSLPASSPPIRWLERDRSRLEAAAAAGFAVTTEALYGSDVDVH